MPAATAALIHGACLLAAVAWPLATYSLSLACFGLAHALVELRVLDQRIRPRLPRRAQLPIVAALAAVFAIRCAANLQWLPRAQAHALELLAGVATVLAVLPLARSRGAAARTTVIAVAAALVLGLLVSPLGTLLVLAVLHNLAPWPLLIDALPPQRRPQAWQRGAITWLAMPLLVLSGVPTAAATALGLAAPEAAPLPSGPLFDQFGAFVGPDPFASPQLALLAFSACVYLQCAHYVAVLGVLPRQGQPSLPRGTVPALLLLALPLLVLWWIDFAGARAWYGTIAGVHAWAEFPALLVLVSASSTTGRSRTTPG
ncbi:MAG: hypothetical protein K1X88_15605 [Nannocystaceae bacterium]|nr:hypothetical protein [Nannocystaceae bacterium]